MNTPDDNRPLIGITMGDPVGIGPEIVVKALQHNDLLARCRPLVLGDAGILEREARFLNVAVSLKVIESPHQAHFSRGTINLLALSSLDPKIVSCGHPTSETGRAMGRYITQAVELALHKEIDAMVTAPINKQSLQDAGFHYPGHTEMLAHLTRTDDVVMMLAGETLRVVLVTIHCALAEVPKLLQPETIVKTILITHSSLQKYFSLPSPRIAVAALNPHAGEAGRFGKEERNVILPAIEQARSKGADVSGPFPPDTLFYHATQGNYDAVVCMYHDQGLIPFKLLHFRDGVNVTLGLPIIRTSVDHGTAYDIAGRGIADPESLLSAIRLAVQMAQAKT